MHRNRESTMFGYYFPSLLASRYYDKLTHNPTPKIAQRYNLTMAAVEFDKQSFSTKLFVNDDGKPMEFHMTPCPQKEILNPLVEVGKKSQ